VRGTEGIPTPEFWSTKSKSDHFGDGPTDGQIHHCRAPKQFTSSSAVTGREQ